MVASNHERSAAFIEEVRREIALVEAQIRRSREARGVAVDASLPHAQPVDRKVQGLTSSSADATEFGRKERDSADNSSREQASPPPLRPDESRRTRSVTFAQPPTSSLAQEQQQPQQHRQRLKEEEEGHSPIPAPPSSYAGAYDSEPQPASKEGYLWHLCGFHDSDLVPHYFVMDARGVRWYDSKDAAHQEPRRKPLGAIRYSLTTTNSRGSVFRKAAVCWPLILPEDAPAVAKDPRKIYFGIDYYQPQSFGASLLSGLTGGSGNTGGGGSGGGSGDGVVSKKLVVATASTEERDAWVAFLRQYIEVYLAPRAESQDLQYLVSRREGSGSVREGSRAVHRSEVIDGEAPGGNYL